MFFSRETSDHGEKNPFSERNGGDILFSEEDNAMKKLIMLAAAALTLTGGGEGGRPAERSAKDRREQKA